MTRVAVLASGSGTNLQAILDQQSALGAAASARVILVASDQAEAGALVRARVAGTTSLALDQTERTTGLAAILASHRVEMVVLAGYMRLVPADVVAHFRGRLLNIHPALLPAFGGPGMFGHRVHEAVLSSGVRLTGPTVHFVDERFDAGPIIAQWPVPVHAGDTADTLAKRVLEVEHVLYPRVVESVAAGRIRLDADNRVVSDGEEDARHFGPTDDVSSATVYLDRFMRMSAR